MEEAYLFANQIRLRVRCKKDSFSLEFKKKVGESYLEISQEIFLEEYHDLIELGNLPAGEIRDFLNGSMGRKKLASIGLVNSLRWKTKIFDGILVLDRTNCKLKRFYSLEFRSWKQTLPDNICLTLGIEGLKSKYKTKLEKLWTI